MNKEEKLQLENELLMTKSKAQMINLYLDKLKEIERLQHNQEVSTKWEIKLTQKNTKLKQENKRLTELCNKYEEEHKTTFETWQKDIKENELLHSIIKEIREYIEKNCYKKMGGYGDNEDDDVEVCLFEDDIWELKEILDKVEEK